MAQQWWGWLLVLLSLELGWVPQLLGPGWVQLLWELHLALRWWD